MFVCYEIEYVKMKWEILLGEFIKLIIKIGFVWNENFKKILNKNGKCILGEFEFNLWKFYFRKFLM